MIILDNKLGKNKLFWTTFYNNIFILIPILMTDACNKFKTYE